MIEAKSDGKQKLRRVTLTGRPTEEFKIPVSTGYSVYSAILNTLNDADEAVSEHVHDTQISSLNCSELQGTFSSANQRFKQTVQPRTTYTITLGITDPEDEAIFKTLLDTLMLDGELELTNGELEIESLESENTTHEEILTEAGGVNARGVEIEFIECTSIEEAGAVTTAFPHRWSVFNNLARKWNASCDAERNEIDLPQAAVLEHVYAQPDTRSFQTHSKLSSRGREDGEVRNVKRQGFTGTCTYKFKDASPSMQNAVVALAKFGEYAGVGSAVARGFGAVSVEVLE